MKNNKFFKKFAATFLAVAILLASAPLSGFADLDFLDLFNISASAQEYSGTCGENLTWTFDAATGELKIEGAGDMYYYYGEEMEDTDFSFAPWYDLGICWRINKITIEDSVTSIGDNAFDSCYNLTSVTLPESVTRIGLQAFANCESLTSIIIPGRVNTIGRWAFIGCSALTSITIPDSVRTIDAGAFSLCKSLKSIKVDESNAVYSSDEYGVLFDKNKTKLIQYPSGNLMDKYEIPDGVTYIGDSAFSNCYNIRTITIPLSVAKIGSFVFNGCGDLSNNGYFSIVYMGTEEEWNNIAISSNNYELLNATIHFAEDEKETVVTGTCGENLTWTFDEETGELRIEGTGDIDARAFSHCDKIETVIIGDGVTSIASCAFSGCTSLVNLRLGNNIKRFEESVFAGCSKLKSVTLPDSVEYVGAFMFDRCTSLEYVTFGKNTKNISIGAFYGCENLRGFIVPTENPFLVCENNVLFSKDMKKLMCYPMGLSETTYIVPEGVEYIRETAFCNSKLRKVTLPDSLVFLGQEAFGNCRFLEKINIPVGVTDIQFQAFSDCDSLIEISIPDSVQYLGEGVFASCNGLTEVHLGESLGKIPNGTFSSCKSLKSIIIPENIKIIGANAFANCSNLESIVIHNSVERIGYYAFNNCSNLTKAYYVGNQEEWDNVLVENNNDDLLENLIVHTHKFNAILTKHPTCSEDGYEIKFCNCGCSHIYDLPKAEDHTWSEWTVTTEPTTENEGSKTRTCSVCSEEETESIPKLEEETVVTGTCGENLTWSFDEETATLTIEGTGDMYDYVCEEINGFNRPVTPWYEQGLHWSINKIVIKDGVTSIGNNAFSCCICSTSISIPDSVTRIGDYAFNECLSIENFTIPDSMTYISNYMFSGCTNLANITIPDTVTNIGYAAFEGCTNLKNITIPESVTSINAGAFAFCSGLESVTIPDGVTSISRGLFGYCTRLKSVTIPGSVTSIGDHAFVYCTSLENVTIPDGVTTINDFVFLGCESLKDITIPERVTGIGQLAFSECASLKSIVIPEAVTWIGSNPFSYCTSLESIKVDEANTTYLSDENGVLFNKDKTKLIQYPNGNTITDYTIPDSVTQITDYAFRGSDYLTSITIPESIISLDLSAFDDCENLHTFYYNGSKTEWEKIDIKPGGNHGGPVEIIFAEVELQESGKCGDNLNWYYYDNGELIIEGTGDMYDYVSDDYYVSDVEKSPWHELPFTKLIVRDGVTSLADEAFWFCDYLKSITIPESITSIDDYEFQACYELTTISIPASVTSIGSGAFGDCFNLTDVYYGGSEEEWSKISFKDSCYAIDYATIHFAESEHEHNYESEITTQPTCTSEGVETFICECGDSYTQTVPEKGHTLSHITVDSTCKVAGMEYDLCSECEEIFNSNKLPLAEHTWSEWTVTAEPTTENEGSKTRTCSVCSKEETESIPKLEVIVNEETGIEIVFGEEYGDGVEVQASEVYDGSSFQLVEANYGNVKTTIFDISTTVDGVAVQPSGKVKVRIPLPEGFEAGKIVVCYVDSENGKVTSIPAKVVDGYVEFETDHFSHYALLATKGKVHSAKIDDVSLYYKDTMFIFPKIKADDGVKYTVEYSSSKPSVAEINRNGQITAKSFGRTTITCTVTDENGNTVTESFKVNVKYTFLQWIIKLFLFGDLWYY